MSKLQYNKTLSANDAFKELTDAAESQKAGAALRSWRYSSLPGAVNFGITQAIWKIRDVGQASRHGDG